MSMDWKNNQNIPEPPKPKEGAWSPDGGLKEHGELGEGAQGGGPL